MKGGIIIGDARIYGVLSEPAKAEDSKLKELDKLIESLGGPEGDKASDGERLPLQLLLTQRAQLTYPELDTSFLTMCNILNYKKQGISVPKFSIYRPIKYYGDGNKFSVHMRRDTHLPYWFPLIKHKFRVYISMGSYGLLDLLQNPLLNSLELYKFSKSKRRDYVETLCEDLPEEIVEKYTKIIKNDRIEITSIFNGIMPQKTKERLEESKKVFREENLYLIVETKQEDWSINAIKEKKLTKDPLLIGIIDDKCFLIDSFNTTSLEEYVEMEWTK